MWGLHSSYGLHNFEALDEGVLVAALKSTFPPFQFSPKCCGCSICYEIFSSIYEHHFDFLVVCEPHDIYVPPQPGVGEFPEVFDEALIDVELG